MTSGFCFNSLINLGFKAETKTLSVSTSASNLLVDADGCGGDRAYQPNSQTTNELSLAVSHHNAPGSCCLNDGHLSILNIAKSLEISHSVFGDVFKEKNSLAIVSKAIVRFDPMTPPPELALLRSTIIRI